MQVSIFCLCVVVLFGGVMSGKESPLYVLHSTQYPDKIAFILRAKLTVAFDVTVGNKTTQEKVVFPQLENVTGDTSMENDRMDLKYTTGNNTYKLSITVVANNTKKSYTLYELKFSYDIQALNASGTDRKTNMAAFSTTLRDQYCADNQNFLLNGNTTVSMEDWRMEAFLNSTSKDFDSNRLGNCPSGNSSTSAIVPIAVGAALGAMILLVLIGYCIGRRRTRAGYEEIHA